MKVIEFLTTQKGLSVTEAKTAVIMANGGTMTTISEDMGVAKPTARNYMDTVKRKLRVTHNEAVAKLCRPYMGMALEENRAKV
jgi:DNA-binding CsgD family transcriptional regulator